MQSNTPPPSTLAVRQRPRMRGVDLEVYERGRMFQNLVATAVFSIVPLLVLVDRWRGGTSPVAVLVGSLIVLAWDVALWLQRDRVALDGDRLRRGFWQLPTDEVMGFEVMGGRVCVVAADGRSHQLFVFDRPEHADYVAGQLRASLAALRPGGYRSDGRRRIS